MPRSRSCRRAFSTRRRSSRAGRSAGVDILELIDDGTYFVIESDGALAGCGGWSRGDAYGGSQTPGRDSALDPQVEPARIRAMGHRAPPTRDAAGRLILTLCERAAAAEGFTRLELMSTPGEPLYTAYGFRRSSG